LNAMTTTLIENVDVITLDADGMVLRKRCPQ
jgi:hypothetical protein